jgi:hypothetical protein
MEADNPKFDAGDDVEKVEKPALLDMKESSGETGVGAKIQNLIKCEYCLLCLAIVFSALMIAMVVQLLYLSPYEPIFWVFIICMVMYWLVSFSLTFLMVKVQKLKNEGNWQLKNLALRPSFWIFLVSLICSFACMLLLLKFIIPESFNSTAGTLKCPSIELHQKLTQETICRLDSPKNRRGDIDVRKVLAPKPRFRRECIRCCGVSLERHGRSVLHKHRNSSSHR